MTLTARATPAAWRTGNAQVSIEANVYPRCGALESAYRKTRLKRLKPIRLAREGYRY